jgi:hypothetical protein
MHSFTHNCCVSKDLKGHPAFLVTLMEITGTPRLSIKRSNDISVLSFSITSSGRRGIVFSWKLKKYLLLPIDDEMYQSMLA